MNCVYCFEKQSNKNIQVISNDDIEHAVDLLLDVDNPGIEFLGGEPTLCEQQMRHCFEYAKSKCRDDNRINFYMITNLFNVPDSMIQLFKEMNDWSHLNIMMTLDGVKEVNDKYRVDYNGNGTWDKIWSNVTRIKKVIPNADIEKHTVLTDHALDHVGEIYKWSMDHINDFSRFTFGMPTIGPTVYKEFELSYDSLDNYIRYYFENIYPNLEKYSSDEIDKLINFMFFKFIPRPNVKHELDVGLCESCRGLVVIRSNGDLTPCVRYIDHHNFTDLTHTCKFVDLTDWDKVNDHWKNNYCKLQSVEDRCVTELTSELGYKCKECTMYPVCPRCFASCELMTGSVDIKPAVLCRRELMMAEIITKYKKVAEQQHRIKLLEYQNNMLRNMTIGIHGINEVMRENNELLTQITGEKCE